MTEINRDITKARERLSGALIKHNFSLAVAESCTGGLLTKVLTDQAGSSKWFECGVVSYSNVAKHAFLAVGEDLITNDGAVSATVAEAMVEGLLALSVADIAISTTGIAGPGGGSAEKPVGSVWFAVKNGIKKPYSIKHIFKGDRDQIRQQAVLVALELLLVELE